MERWGADQVVLRLVDNLVLIIFFFFSSLTAVGGRFGGGKSLANHAPTDSRATLFSLALQSRPPRAASISISNLM